MAHIHLTVAIDAPQHVVWDCVRDLSSHTEWMSDAVAIRFTSSTTAGVGTSFDCDTRIGPLRTTDRMVVTEWTEGVSIGIRHEGAIAGVGRFLVEPRGPGATLFTWDEGLRFPLWMGGSVAGICAEPVLRHIWRGNLARLKLLVERSLSPI